VVSLSAISVIPLIAGLLYLASEWMTRSAAKENHRTAILHVDVQAPRGFGDGTAQ
jgi:hypothetical protein